MQVQHLRRTGSLVQIVHILRDDAHVEVVFQFGQEFMPPIGARFDQLPAQSVVKLIDKIGIALPSLGRGHLFHGMRFPKSATVAKGGKTTLGAHTGAGEHHDFFLLCCHIIYPKSTLQKYAFFKFTSLSAPAKCYHNAKKAGLIHIIDKECLPLLH